MIRYWYWLSWCSWYGRGTGEGRWPWHINTFSCIGIGQGTFFNLTLSILSLLLHTFLGIALHFAILSIRTRNGSYSIFPVLMIIGKIILQRIHLNIKTSYVYTTFYCKIKRFSKIFCFVGGNSLLTFFFQSILIRGPRIPG